jgi:hypothetical protein
VIRQGLDAGVIDEPAIIVAPVILGGGKALFDGFTKSLELEHIGVRQMERATLIEYRVKKQGGPGRARLRLVQTAAVPRRTGQLEASGDVRSSTVRRSRNSLRLISPRA